MDQGRHILASLYFHENLLRQTKKTEDGKDYYKVSYPKFKLGEEVVREIAVPPTYAEEQDALRASLTQISPQVKEKDSHANVVNVGSQ